MTDLTDFYGCHKCGFMSCTCLDGGGQKYRDNPSYARP